MNLNDATQETNSQYERILKSFGTKLPNRDQSRKLSIAAEVDEVSFYKYVWGKNRTKVNNRKIVKFTEALWRFIFYSVFTGIGIYSIIYPERASWVQDTEQHWKGWPFNDVSPLIDWYYLLELGCYIHQLMWTEVNRSDAFEMILHHLVTISLILLSYLTRFSRIGASILLVHDFADIFLEIGKCFNYICKSRDDKGVFSMVVDSIFATFAISFLVTRLIIFPRYLLSSLLFEAPRILGMWPGYWVFAGLLVTLQCLHVFWFYLILKMAWRLLFAGESIEKDVRSDDDDVLVVADDFNDTGTNTVTNTNTNNAKKKQI